MISPWTSPLADHLWQSTVFAVAAGLLTIALRKNRAQLRYAVWLAASIKFLVPFSLLVSLGSLVDWRAAPEVPVRVSSAIGQISRPFTQPFPAVVTPAPASTTRLPWQAALAVVWLGGSAFVLVRWRRRWLRVRAVLSTATAMQIASPVPVLSAPTQLEPGVFGVFRPVLLLPEGIEERLVPAQLESVLAHEFCHVRRRDNLLAAVHMLVEAIFWFHPLVWWIGTKLVDERERACDEEVLRLGNEPLVYASGILKVCRHYVESPLACASGVTGSELKGRIEAIMLDNIASKLTITKKLLLGAAAMTAIAGPMLIGMLNPMRGRAQSKPETLTFEVASIKRLDPNEQASGPIPLAPGLTPGGGIRSRVPIFNLICWAYRIDGAQLSGGPAWVRSDRYAIDAKPEKFEGPDDPNMPSSEQQTNRTRDRVKALLADRFQMTVRTETKEAQVYVLSIAKGGHKLTPDPEGRGGVRFLGDAIESSGAPISFLAVPLTHMLGRPVLDETGLDGRFKYQLEFRPDDAVKRNLALAGQPVPDDDPRPSIFTAIKSQLGLELQSRKGPVRSVVLERIERPTEN